MPADMFCTQICDLEHEFLNIPFSLCASQVRLLLSRNKWIAQKEKTYVNTHAHASAWQFCVQNICGQRQNLPMADPTFGSKSGPQKGPKQLKEEIKI